MKTNWQTKKLEEIVDFIGGLWVGKKEPFVKANVLRNTNFRNTGLLNFDNVAEIDVEEKQLPSRTLEKGDIILEKSGGGPDQPVGRVAYFDTDGIYSYSNFTCCIRIINKTEVDSKYLWYFLHSQYSFGVTEKMQKQTTGIRNLIMPEYKNLEIPLPPLATQRKIVVILDEKFAKLREAKQLRQEALADTEKILSQTLREIFEKGKEKVWEEKELEKVSFINPVKSEIKEISDNTQVSFIPMASVSDISQSIEAQQTKTLGEVRKGYTYFKRGDVILAKVTPCMENGKIAYTENLDYTYGFGSSEFHVIRANEDFVLPKFIYQILRTEDFRKEAKEKMTGTSGLKRVPKEFIEKYKILIPPLSEQQKIVDRLDVLSAQISTLRKLQQDQLADLKKLEKAYLREAFRGELI